MRTNHLNAISDGKGAKAKEILRKIHAEDSKTMWFQIGRAMKGPRGGATLTVRKMTKEGLVKESTTQEETEEMIFEEIEYRFQHTMDAPLCMLKSASIRRIARNLLNNASPAIFSNMTVRPRLHRLGGHPVRAISVTYFAKKPLSSAE